ncbi:MAG: hypothetical protein WKI04_17365 [Ferruginibacter sp.]
MKKLSLLLSFAIVSLLSCSGDKTYTVETYYKNNNGGADTSLTSEKDKISADSDSAAYINAQEKFNGLAAKAGDKKGTPVKFTIRDKEGVIVIAPGNATKQDPNSYPNQRSPD